MTEEAENSSKDEIVSGGGAAEVDEQEQAITFDLLARLHLEDYAAVKSDHDRLVRELLAVTHIRLNGFGIRTIENLECLGRVSHLYLKNNKIESLEGVECLVDLKLLDVAHNAIADVAPLCFLRHLQWLDVSFNALRQFDGAGLSGALAFLHLRGNPLPDAERERAVASLPNLKQLDGEWVEREDEDGEDESAEGAKDEPGAVPGAEQETSTEVVRGSEATRDALIASARETMADMCRDIEARMAQRMQEIELQHRKHQLEIAKMRLGAGAAPQS